MTRFSCENCDPKPRDLWFASYARTYCESCEAMRSAVPRPEEWPDACFVQKILAGAERCGATRVKIERAADGDRVSILADGEWRATDRLLRSGFRRLARHVRRRLLGAGPRHALRMHGRFVAEVRCVSDAEECIELEIDRIKVEPGPD